MTHDSSRWLVTINGRVPTDADMRSLSQWHLATFINAKGQGSGASARRSEFVDATIADRFRGWASREFPEDDVRLWTSVDPSRNER